MTVLKVFSHSNVRLIVSKSFYSFALQFERNGLHLKNYSFIYYSFQSNPIERKLFDDPLGRKSFETIIHGNS